MDNPSGRSRGDIVVDPILQLQPSPDHNNHHNKFTSEYDYERVQGQLHIQENLMDNVEMMINQGGNGDEEVKVNLFMQLEQGQLLEGELGVGAGRAEETENKRGKRRAVQSSSGVPVASTSSRRRPQAPAPTTDGTGVASSSRQQQESLPTSSPHALPFQHNSNIQTDLDLEAHFFHASADAGYVEEARNDETPSQGSGTKDGARKPRGRPKGLKDGPNVDKQRRGRPKGAKNVKGLKREREREDRLKMGLDPDPKKKRGRPFGSKNRPKTESEDGSTPQPTKRRRTAASRPSNPANGDATGLQGPPSPSTIAAAVSAASSLGGLLVEPPEEMKSAEMLLREVGDPWATG